nr:PREDICTED: DNA polymerase epsilon subunit 3 [Opisthocomus hoazin]
MACPTAFERLVSVIHQLLTPTANGSELLSTVHEAEFAGAKVLPDGVNISKEARSAISRAASVFVLYATSCANNFAMKGKRKTLNASNVLSAMEEMERFFCP